MKTISVLVMLFLCSMLQAQISSPAPAAYPSTPANFIVGQQEANSRVWQKIIQTLDAQGHTVLQTNQAYVELATGLNHFVKGQWVASSEEIDVSPDGSSAMATNGQHQAYFPTDIATGVIKLITADGQQLQSRPIALSYNDGSSTVLIALLTNSVGVVAGYNQVIYPNAFDGMSADVRYTYLKAGFEQDVVLEGRPPTPDSLGLNPQTARLQVITEFFSPPAPLQASSPANPQDGLQDTTLTFGQMKLIQGKAFAFPQTQNFVTQTPTYKRWLQLQGGTFLVEEVPYQRVSSQLQALPATASIPVPSPGSVLYKVSSTLLLPPAYPLKAAVGGGKSKLSRLASADFDRKPGVVLDYVAVNSGITNYTFQGDTTYLISSPVYAYGVVTLEGGTVIKYDTRAVWSSLQLWGNVICNTGPYRPAIFTSFNDNTVGQSGMGVSGTPQDYYSVFSIDNSGQNVSLHDIRISYTQWGLHTYGENVTLTNAQFVNCGNAFYPEYCPCTLENVLICNATNALGGTDYSITGSHITVDGCSLLTSDYNNPLWSSVALTNSLLFNVTTNGAVPLTTNYTYTASSPTVVFQAVGAGSCYLAANCPTGIRGAGTTNIDPVLLAQLQTKTTYAPNLLTNTITNATVLQPVVQRDNNSSPDLGYHYSPIDYLVSNVSVSATLTLTNGVALGLMGSSASLALQNNGSLISQGTALALNHLVHYLNVQEQPIGLGSGALTQSGLGTNMNVGLRFTDISMPAGGYTYVFYGVHSYGPEWSLRDCLLHGCYFVQVSMIGTQYVAVTNNLFDRCNWALVGAGGLSAGFYNNLFRGGFITMYSDSSLSVQDNLFDQSSLSGTSTNNLTCSNNGFTAGTTNYLGGASNKTNLVADYRAGPLGKYYYPSSGGNLSQLINAGSTNAAALGLYHYTVQTNLVWIWTPPVGNYEVPEGNNTVSIGFHYVAVDQYGNPLDSNGDGIPDYLQDANGNGLVDSGEIGWNITGDVGLNILITKPRNSSILP
jgi:hypothetical protein